VHSRRPALLLVALALLGSIAAPAAAGPRAKLSVPLADTPLEACPGDPIDPGDVVEGRFPSELTGATVMLPFEVPAGTTSVRVKYCYGSTGVVDLGLWHARPGKKPWAVEQFRGWGGSSHPDVTITPQGFSTEAEYEAAPRGHVPGRTTRGFVPGPIPPGSWAAELGVAFAEEAGVDFRVEIELSEDPAFAAEPYEPAVYDPTPANPAPGWYAGDMHVHAEHSALGDATMTETFDYAFRSLEDGGAGLDFITLSDYVTPTGWGEVGRYQALHPGKLVIRSSEIITYHGHSQNHASLRYVDHRAGPLYELLRPSGELKRERKKRDPKQFFKEVRAAGGWTQLNHVRTCPLSFSPSCASICRGCSWDYTPKQTKLAFVDAIEVHNGTATETGTSPWTVGALEFWEEALDGGFRIAGVGSSDSHHAGETPGTFQSPLGIATTVVYAQELSEAGIGDAVRAGHAYVKVYGNAGPDLRLEGRVPGSAEPAAIMGDLLKANAVDFTAQVLNVDPEDEALGALELVVLKNGVPVESAPVGVPGAEHTFSSSGPGRYRVELRRGAALVAFTNPIYVKRKRK
jgi:hypothetical protein